MITGQKCRPVTLLTHQTGFYTPPGVYLEADPRPEIPGISDMRLMYPAAARPCGTNDP